MSEGRKRERVQLIFPFSIFLSHPAFFFSLFFFSYPFSYPSLPPLLLIPTSPNLSHLELNLPRSHQTRNRLNRHSRRHYRRHDSFGHRQSFRKLPLPSRLEIFSFFLSKSDALFSQIKISIPLAFIFFHFFSFSSEKPTRILLSQVNIIINEVNFFISPASRSVKEVRNRCTFPRRFI